MAKFISKSAIILSFFGLLLANFAFGMADNEKITDENGEAVIGATIVLRSNRGVGTVAD